MSKVLTSAIILASIAARAQAAEVPVKELLIAKTLAPTQADTEVKAAKAFYQFWNTGDASLLQAAISPKFVDHALPPGRPQGPKGPAFASEHFRAAVPDLSVEVLKMIVADAGSTRG